MSRVWGTSLKIDPISVVAWLVTSYFEPWVRQNPWEFYLEYHALYTSDIFETINPLCFPKISSAGLGIIVTSTEVQVASSLSGMDSIVDETIVVWLLCTDPIGSEEVGASTKTLNLWDLLYWVFVLCTDNCYRIIYSFTFKLLILIKDHWFFLIKMW